MANWFLISMAIQVSGDKVFLIDSVGITGYPHAKE